MAIRRSVITGAVVGSVLVFGFAFPAHAELTDTEAGALVAAALETEDITITDPELEQAIVDAVQEASELDIINPEIVDEVVTDPAVTEPTDPATETPAPTEDPGTVDELIDDNEDSQVELWNDLGPQIQEAFDVIRADFEACREAGTVSTCARTLGLRFQVALTEVKIAAIEEQIVAAESLPEEEREVVVAELQAAQERVLAQLATKQARLASRAIAVDEKDAAKANALLQTYGVAAVDPAAVSEGAVPEPDTSAGVRAVDPGTGAANNGNSGGENPNKPADKPANSGVDNSNKPADNPGKSNNGNGKSNGKGNGANQ